MFTQNTANEKQRIGKLNNSATTKFSLIKHKMCGGGKMGENSPIFSNENIRIKVCFIYYEIRYESGEWRDVTSKESPTNAQR